MEYIQGETLRSIINRQGTLGIEQTLFLFKKILIAVRGLHNFRQKIIHRDLKPENIIISRDLTSLKIIDFGISTVLLTARDNNSKENKILTSENELYGTFPYISPLLYKA
jgi:serine/threonine-protein kinase